MDSVLAIAHTLTADLLCSGCGQPKHEAYNPDAAGWYEVKDAECNGCAALARDGDIHKESHPERKLWVVDERPPDKPLKPWQPA